MPNKTLCESCIYAATDGSKTFCMIDAANPIAMENGFPDCSQHIKDNQGMLSVAQYQALTPDEIAARMKRRPVSEQQRLKSAQEGSAIPQQVT
jgi:hypothetical protein